ncbi:hypothetical protein D3C81_1863180 [compost metagenome]
MGLDCILQCVALQVDRIGAVAEVGVGVVESDRHVAHPNLPRTGLADLGILVTQDFRSTGFMEAYDFGHSRSPVLVLVECPITA